MEDTHMAPLTPEQIAAITAGNGFARCEDPNTHRQYELTEVEPITIPDVYIQKKIEEAYADIDRGDVAKWDVDEINRELQKRLAAKQDRNS
jgi:hypothetical protein